MLWSLEFSTRAINCSFCCSCCSFSLAIIISSSIASWRFRASCLTRSSYCSCCSCCVFSQTASDDLAADVLLLCNAANRACSRCSFSRKMRSASVARHRASSFSLANRRARSNLLSSTVCFCRAAASSASSSSFCCSRATFFFLASSIRRSISAISRSVSSVALLFLLLEICDVAVEAPRIPEATPAAVFFNIGFGIGSLMMSLLSLVGRTLLLLPFFCTVAQSGFSH